MEVKHKKHEAPKQQMEEESGSDSANAQSTLDQGAEVLGQAEEAVNSAYDKATHAVCETYEKAKSYGSNNPGKTMLFSLGVGVGLGFLLGASSRRSGTIGRFARPVVNALSGIALELFR
ncbi:MAG: hypothetical protein HY881_12540 [Deltaproteobacteria bacterium]|nr:hypothetical protein [Deltaproteobacteria bacterium]